MVTANEEDLDTQAFARIQADLLAPPNPAAATETPRASRATASSIDRPQTRRDGNLRGGQLEIPSGAKLHNFYGINLRRLERSSSPPPDSVTSYHLNNISSSLKHEQERVDELTTGRLGSEGGRPPSPRQEGTKMDNVEDENPQTTSNSLNDTQELPTQVYADYFNSEKRLHSSYRPIDYTAKTQNNDQTAFQAYNAGDVGHVNLDADTETNATEVHQPPHTDDESSLLRHDQESLADNDESESVTSPVAPSPVTPAIAGRKHDRDGNVLEPEPEALSNDDAPSQDLTTLFKVPQGKPTIGLSQVFNQTQAATSPVQDEIRSDPVFDRPSPDFYRAARASSPMDTSPDLVRKEFQEKTTQGPRDVYISVRQSQERRKVGESTKAYPSQEEDDDSFGLNEHSVERRLARRYRRIEIDESSRRDFASLQTPASKQAIPSVFMRGSANSLVTPATRRKGKGVVEISDDTPLSVVAEVENAEDELSDAVSMDEYDELSQTVISTGKRTTRFPQQEAPHHKSASSPSLLPDPSSGQLPAHPPITKGASTAHVSSDTQGDGNNRWSYPLPSQTVRVADSQPDRIEKQRQRPPTQRAHDALATVVSSDSGQVIPQSQAVPPQGSVSGKVMPPPEVPESSSASASGQAFKTSETEQGPAVPASPASSPPINGQSSSANNVENVALKDTSNTKYHISPPPPKRRRLRRTIPDTSPTKSDAQENDHISRLEVPSASLPETRNMRDQTSSRSLARSNSTNTFETAKTHHSIPQVMPVVAEKGSQLASPSHQRDNPTDGEAAGDTLQVVSNAVPKQAQGVQPQNTGSSQENRPPQTRASKARNSRQTLTKFKSPSSAKLERKPFAEDSNSANGAQTALQPERQHIARSNNSICSKAIETIPTAPNQVEEGQDIDRANERQKVQAAPGQTEQPNPTTAHVTVDSNLPPIMWPFPRRVFARFKDPKMLFYPATCLGRASESSFRVRFDDGIVDNDVSDNLVKILELRTGDIVKVDRRALRKNEYFVRELSSPVTNHPAYAEAYGPPLTDILGYEKLTVELKKRTSFSTNTTDRSTETFQVPLSEIYLTQQLFTRLEGRNAPDATILNFDQGLHTPVDGPSRPGTPSSRNRRHAAQITKNSTIQESNYVPISRGGLFSNMIFAISHVLDKDFDEKKVLAEKSLTSKLITENGGLLLAGGFEELFESVNEDDTVSDPDSKVARRLTLNGRYSNSGFAALITNSYSRSPKFIQALALNLPCLSTRWIIDSVEGKTLQSWSHYLLPAGRSKLLGDVVRSRTFPENAPPTFNPAANKLTEIVDHRLRFLKGHRIVIVVGKTKSEQERRQTYVFLSYALGAESVKRVKDIDAARTLLSLEPSKWTLIGVDEDNVERAKLQLFPASHGVAPAKSGASNSRSKTRKPVDTIADPNTHNSAGTTSVKIIGTEYIVQSLIIGKLVD